MKKFISLFLVLAMALSLMACGGGAASSAAASEAPKEESKAEEPKAEESKAEESKAEASQAEEKSEEVTPENFDWHGEGKLVIYSGDASDITEKQVAAFTELTGVECEVVYGGGSELLARIEAEKDNPLGDVMKGATSDNLSRYTEYFTPYKLESVTPEQIGHDAPLEEGYWTEGAGGNMMIFMVNKELLPEEDWPTKWEDLIDEKYKGQIAFCDPNASSSAYIHLNCMMQLYGWDFVEKFYQNLDGKIMNSSSNVPKQTADGEYAIGVTIENYGADYTAAGANIAVIYPEDGTMRTRGGTVIIKNCKNPENAKLWCEFSYSKAMSEIAVSFNRRPSRTDVDLPAGLKNFNDIKFMDYDYDLAADSAPILDKWNEIVINNG